MKDTRELITFERRLGLYSVAGAICSYGDVIGFVDGDKQGIIIADTCGKEKNHGDQAGEFLRREIEKGWGSSRDAKTEILDLGRRLMIAGHGEPHYKRRKLFSEREWWDAIEFCYVHFFEEAISLTGLRHLIYRENGKIEWLESMLGPYHFDNSVDREPTKTNMNGNDVLMIASDGLEWNMKLPYRNSLEDLRKYHEKPKRDIENIIGNNKELPVKRIRDALISELSEHITGKYFSDDVTFAVVKRN